MRSRFAPFALASLVAATWLSCGSSAEAQPQPQPQPYPSPPPNQGPPPGGQYPPPGGPYPPPGGPYPPPGGPYPPPGGPYPPPGGPYPPPGGQYPPPGGQYPPPGGPYPPPGGPYPPPGGPYPPPAAPDPNRGPGEMTFLYITSSLYGIGTGVWLDALAKVKDPGLAIIMPLALGAAAPIGVYFWDSQGGPLHRGVPASMATGLVLGGVEGVAIAGTQWQYTRDKCNDWSFATQTTVTWVMATGGGVGGWAFGEWLRPDPRSMGFIAGGAAWGTLAGSFTGIAASGKDWKDGASVGGLIGYNVGLVSAGAISVAYTPSWQTQKNMWLGELAGSLIGCLVFPFYLFSTADAKHGFIGPGLGGLAGVAIAGALSWDLKDPEDVQRRARAKIFEPPVDITFAPAPRLDASSVSLGSGPLGPMPQGTMLMGSGTF